MEELNPPERLLLGAGPSNIHPRVTKAIMSPILGHLDPYFIEIMDETKKGLAKAFKTQNEFSLPISGTGTAAMEAAICNAVQDGDEVIVGVNGFFAERMAEMIRRWGGKTFEIKKRWGDIVTKEEVEDCFKNSNANLVALVQGETSTGALQPLQDIAKIARAYDSLLLVDAVTSFTGVELDIDRWGIDICYSSPQKCLNAPPGASPITVDNRAMDRIRNRRDPVQSLYFDFTLIERYWSERRMYHHTAPIINVYGLREALRIALEEGLESRIERHRRNSEALVAGVEAAGLEMNTESEYTLPSLNAVRVPEGVDEERVRKILLKRFNMEVGAGLGELKGQVWRVGLMGMNSSERNVLFVLEALEVALRMIGHPLKPSVAVNAATDYYGTH
jgi:alanine-glyoxylate transaminase/serine-glyoxylate transaminase/serine-pyruvate transaminase